MTQEEKAKRYDDAYKVAKNIHIFSSDLAEIKRMEEIFSELKEESEDERIRKKICKILWDNVPYEEAQEYITWLEKQCENKSINNLTQQEAMDIAVAKCFEQGEQKPVIEMKTPEESLGIDSETYSKIVDECIYGKQKPANKVEPKFKIGDNIEPIDTCLGSPRTIYKICDGFYETNQGTLDFEFENNWRLIEQKPAWSEEDDKIIEEIINDIECARAINYHDSKEGYEFRENWLESLKDRVQPQPKQEWTEEDERIIKRIDSLLYSINESEFEDIHAWLEFLKNRVQPKQEWSKEDEVKINRIVACLENLNIADNDILLKDVDWLKSLKYRVQLFQDNYEGYIENEKDKHQ